MCQIKRNSNSLWTTHVSLILKLIIAVQILNNWNYCLNAKKHMQEKWITNFHLILFLCIEFVNCIRQSSYCTYLLFAMNCSILLQQRKPINAASITNHLQNIKRILISLRWKIALHDSFHRKPTRPRECKQYLRYNSQISNWIKCHN